MELLGESQMPNQNAVWHVDVVLSLAFAVLQKNGDTVLYLDFSVTRFIM